MSLILDALKKADSERDYSDAVPDLKTVHSVAVVDHSSDKRILWLGVALAVTLSFLVIVLGVYWWRTSVPSDAPVSSPVKSSLSSASSAAVDRVAVSPPVQMQPLPAQPAPVSDEVQALYRVQKQETVQKIVEPVVKTIKPIQARSTVDESLAQVLWDEAKRDVPAAQPVTANRAVPEEPEEPEVVDAPFDDTLAAYEAVPFLHELPVALQNSIPTLMYALHNYQNGTVMINKNLYRNGDEIKSGVVVSRVLADGLLLELNGVEFKLSSLSSWVNY